MLVRAGPWQHNSRDGSKPLRWDAIGDFWTFPTKTIWWTKRFASESKNLIGVHYDLLTMVKKRKLRWYGHIPRSSGMAKTILQGTVKWAIRRGRQKKRWDDNIKEWTGMGFGVFLRAAEDRERLKGIVATSSVMPWRPSRYRDWFKMTCAPSDDSDHPSLRWAHRSFGWFCHEAAHFIILLVMDMCKISSANSPNWSKGSGPFLERIQDTAFMYAGFKKNSKTYTNSQSSRCDCVN